MALQPTPTFFEGPADFAVWLAEHGATAGEVWVGFYKKGADRRGITYAEALDEALCVGWIDAVRKGLDAATWAIRFTPRKSGSIWSGVNLARVEELKALGRMRPSGLAIYEQRNPAKERIYTYEVEARELSPEYAAQLEANADAAAFFRAQAPGYRRQAQHWVMSAKQEPTRQKRLATLIEDSAAGRILDQYRRRTWKGKE